MSSHHIIRDEQEPPVLVFEIWNNWDSLSELLGWSPLLVVEPDLENLFQARQTKIDGFLIEKSSNREFNSQDLVYSTDDLVHSLLKWISQKNYTAINIFTTELMLMEFYHKFQNENLPIPLIVFTELGKSILKPQRHFKKWYPADTKIQIMNNEIRQTKNLILEGDLFKVEKDGFVEISVGENLILIKEI